MRLYIKKKLAKTNEIIGNTSPKFVFLGHKTFSRLRKKNPGRTDCQRTKGDQNSSLALLDKVS